MYQVKTPIVFLVFNRPDVTEITFKAIAHARPKKLLIVADGPRASRPNEKVLCERTRKIVELVDWDCEVITEFSDVNLGCKKRVSSGLTWAFELVDEAIILEDDCVPDPTFFQFCDELLEKYRHDHSVMMISGDCFHDSKRSLQESYYFSHMPLIWGWATWRRAWRQYDISMSKWPEYRQSGKLKTILPSLSARWHHRQQLDRAYRGEIDTWDIQWTYTVWQSNGVCIIPTRNLVHNIGFGPEATHTVHADSSLTPPAVTMQFPLVHPHSIKADSKIDREWIQRHHGLKSKVMRRLSRLIKAAMP